MTGFLTEDDELLNQGSVTAPPPAPGRIPTVRGGLRPLMKDPTLGEVAGASFRLSVPGLVWREWTAERAEAVPGYDPFPEVKGTKYERNQAVLTARSPGELAEIKANIDRNEQDRLIEGASPAVSAVIQEVLNPVNLLLTAPPARLISGALRGATVVGATSVATEATRLSLDPVARLDEALANIGTSTAMGAIFGRLVARTAPEARALEVYLNRGDGAVARGESTVGAAQAGNVLREGDYRPASGAGPLGSIGDSPLKRATMAGVDESGETAAQLFPLPWLSEGNLRGRPNPGNVHSDQYPWQRRLAETLGEASDDYLDYRGSSSKGVWGSIKTTVGDVFGGRAAGVLSPAEFRERAWAAAISGADDAIPQVTASARRYRALVDELGRKAGDVGLIDPELVGRVRTWETANGPISEWYLPRVWNLGAIDANWNGFVSRVGDWLELRGGSRARAEAVAQGIRERGPFTGIDDEHVGAAAATYSRRFDAPTGFFSDYVVKDPEALVRYYVRTMGVDTSLAARFGGVTPQITDQTLRRFKAREGVTMRNQIEDVMAGWIFKIAGEGQEQAARQVIDDLKAALKTARESASRAYRDLGDNPTPDEIAAVRERFMADKKLAILSAQRATPGDAELVAKGFAEMGENVEDIRALRDLSRGTYGQSTDPMGWGPRTARVAKQVANMTLLTGMSAALVDLGAINMREGMERTFGVGLKAFMGGFQALKIAGKEAQLAGTALDMVLSSRVLAMSDLSDIAGRYSMFERMIDNASTAAFIVNGINPWTAGIKQFAAAVIQSRMLDDMLKISADDAASFTAAAQATRESLREAQSGVAFSGVVYRGAGGGGRARWTGGGAHAFGDGAASFYATTEDAARQFGERVTVSEINLQRPWVLRSDDDALALFRAAGLPDPPETYLTEPWLRWRTEAGRGSPLSEMSPAAMRERQREAFSRAQEWLQAQGYDGVIVDLGGAQSAAGRTSRLRERSSIHRRFGNDQIIAFNSEATTQIGRLFGNGQVDPLGMRRLAQSGIDPAMARRIADQAEAHGRRDGQLWLPNTTEWTDAGAVGAFRRALAESVDQTIVTPNKGEAAGWLSTELGSLVGQYIAFAQATLNRLVIPALQERDVRALYGALDMVLMGMLVDELRRDAKGIEREPSIGERIYRGIQRSGLAGYWGNMDQAVMSLTDNRFGVGAMMGVPEVHANRGAFGKLADLAGPAASQGARAIGVGYDLVTGNAGAKTWTEASKLLPLANVTHIQWGMRQVEKAMKGDSIYSER